MTISPPDRAEYPYAGRQPAETRYPSARPGAGGDGDGDGDGVYCDDGGGGGEDGGGGDGDGDGGALKHPVM